MSTHPQDISLRCDHCGRFCKETDVKYTDVYTHLELDGVDVECKRCQGTRAAIAALEESRASCAEENHRLRSPNFAYGESCVPCLRELLPILDLKLQDEESKNKELVKALRDMEIRALEAELKEAEADLEYDLRLGFEGYVPRTVEERAASNALLPRRDAIRDRLAALRADAGEGGR